jgi:hypothetical protein
MGVKNRVLNAFEYRDRKYPSYNTTTSLYGFVKGSLKVSYLRRTLRESTPYIKSAILLKIRGGGIVERFFGKKTTFLRVYLLISQILKNLFNRNDRFNKELSFCLVSLLFRQFVMVLLNFKV